MKAKLWSMFRRNTVVTHADAAKKISINTLRLRRMEEWCQIDTKSLVIKAICVTTLS